MTSLPATDEARPLPPFVRGWLAGLHERVAAALRAGDQSCIRAARAALAEGERAIAEMAAEVVQ